MDFLVIGVQKGGTTWLEQNLIAHPEVVTPKGKEIHFFDKDYNWKRGQDWYEGQLGKAVGRQRVRGEYTPNYFWRPFKQEVGSIDHLPDIAQRVKSLYPDVRLIVTLRDPLERAISAYYHCIKMLRVHPETRITEVWEQWGIVSMGRYAESLVEWREAFGEQLMVLDYEKDIVGAPDRTLENVYRHIGVDDRFRPTGIERRRNPRVSGFVLRVRWRWAFAGRVLMKFWPGLGSGWKRFDVTVTEDERAFLQGKFE